MEFHPLANIFPLMSGAEFAALVSDIAENGLREPIVTLDGAILDGRNRWRACQDAGVPPLFAQYSGGDPVRYVISLNLRRRHLNEAQRGAVAAKLANMRQGERTDLEPSADLPKVSQSAAAELLNVGERTVRSASKVLREGVPELVDALEQGTASASAAAAVATLPQEQQRDIVAAGPEAVVEAAKAVHNHRAVSTGEYEWYTPSKYIEKARAFLGVIDLDPASSAQAQETVKAGTFFSENDNGLEREWFGRVWLNPPYKQPDIQMFMQKALDEYRSGRVVEAIILTHNYTDTAWFHIGASVATAICFTRGRISFTRYDGATGSPAQGQAFFYLGKRPKSFASDFSEIGFVVMPL